MTTPDQASDTALKAQELTEENLEEVSGGAASPKLFSADPDGDGLTHGGGTGGLGSNGGNGGLI